MTSGGWGSTLVVPIDDASQVGEGRRRVARVAQEQGLSADQQGRLALVVTELGTNLIKHARGGMLLVCPRKSDGASGVEIVALDRGPGINDIGAALADGQSTAGTAGNGLGAVRRLSSEFDLYSTTPGGTAILTRLWSEKPTPSGPFSIGGVCIPLPGEEVSGDDWDARATPTGCRVIVVDGLGHGPLAHEAAQQALSVFRTERVSETLGSVLEACHLSLRMTRGAALALLDVNAVTSRIDYAAVGNIAGLIASAGADEHMVSVNGIVGHGTFRSRPVSYAFPSRGVVVLSSDGLQTRWNLDAHPGLAARDPSLIAAVLFRDHARGRDDTTVVVLKETAA